MSGFCKNHLQIQLCVWTWLLWNIPYQKTNAIVNCDFAIPPFSNYLKIYNKSIFSDFIQFQIMKLSFSPVFLLVNSFNFLQPYWLLIFTIGSFGRLHVSSLTFSISLCTEGDILNSIETAVCNSNHIYYVPYVVFLPDIFRTKYFLTYLNFA